MVVSGIRSLVATLLLSAGLAAPAAADVIYSFVETSYSAPPENTYPLADPHAQLTIEVTDSAAAHGFSFFQEADTGDPYHINYTGPPETPLDLTGSGIVRIAFGVFPYQSGPSFNSFASQGCYGPLCVDPGWIVDLRGDLSGISGEIGYFGISDYFTFTLSPAPALTTGTWLSDNGGITACGEGTSEVPFFLGETPVGCTFAGVMAVSQVPEPGALGLLATGLAGLLVVGRRRLRLPA